MNKPRLAEILGVEVGERFRVKDSDDAIYCVNEQGYLDYGDNTAGYVNAGILCDIISSPELIIHLPRWTQRDIEDAKAVKRLFPDAYSVKKIVIEHGANGIDFIDVFIIDTEGETISVGEECFPCLDYDKETKLDDIIDSEAKDNE